MSELKNHMEVVVRQALEDYLSKNKISCTCELCQGDIMALALNNLPPRYYASSQGEILTKMKSQEATALVLVMGEITRAAQLISASPSHPIG